MSKGSSRGGKRKTKSHKSTSIARLYVTHETAENAFKFEPSQDSLCLYVSKVQHNNFYGDHSVTFSEIVQYNSRGQNNVNRNIGNPPLVFPTTTDQVYGMPSWKNAMKVFDRSLKDQLRSIGTSMMKVELHVA